jgi:hypothetical protein
MMFVLLTATVTPQVRTNLALVDAESRRRQYRSSLRQWANICDPSTTNLVLVENSGEDLRALAESALGSIPPNIRLISAAKPSSGVVNRGKGATEGLMVDEAIASLGVETENQLLFKCTGRLFVKNFASTIDLARGTGRSIWADVPRSKFDWIDSRYFGATLSVWRDEFQGVGSASDDSQGLNYEHDLATVINSAAASSSVRVLTFREKPHFEGQSGTTGQSYTDGRNAGLKRRVLRPLDRVRRRIDREFRGH